MTRSPLPPSDAVTLPAALESAAAPGRPPSAGAAAHPIDSRRSIAEWIGKHPDEAIPPRVKQRILERQNRICALSGAPIPPGVTPHFDHCVALRDGGEHREGNLQAALPGPHQKKTAREAKERARADARAKSSHGLHNEPVVKLHAKPFPLGKKRDKHPMPMPARTKDIFGRPI